MSPLLLYIARAGLYLSLFYTFYLLVMRRTTFFGLNRLFLLAGSYISLLLPLVRIGKASPTLSLYEPAVTAIQTPSEITTASGTFPWQTLLLGIYLIGVLITLIGFFISTRKMVRLIKSGQERVVDGFRLVLLEREQTSFSWGRKIVISRKDMEENGIIFIHEQMHVRYRHSLDILLLLPLQHLFWWNPLVWITRDELRLLHEYQADEGVIKKGIDATQYQLILVRKAVGDQRFTLASGFQHAKLKNRIEMMIKPQTSAKVRWSYLALIPVMAIFMVACNPKQQQKTNDDSQTATTKAAVESTQNADVVPFEEVDVKPGFNGGDANAFNMWVAKQLNYPAQAIKDNVQGRVMIQFTIGTDGAVKDAKVLRGVREDVDQAALKVVAASPKWKPGTKADGTAVPVSFVVPVVFKLN